MPRSGCAWGRNDTFNDNIMTIMMTFIQILLDDFFFSSEKCNSICCYGFVAFICPSVFACASYVADAWDREKTNRAQCNREGSCVLSTLLANQNEMDRETNRRFVGKILPGEGARARAAVKCAQSTDGALTTIFQAARGDRRMLASENHLCVTTDCFLSSRLNIVGRWGSGSRGQGWCSGAYFTLVVCFSWALCNSAITDNKIWWDFGSHANTLSSLVLCVRCPRIVPRQICMMCHQNSIFSAVNKLDRLG